MTKLSIYFVVLVFLVSCAEKPDRDSRVDELPYYKDALFTPHWLNSQSDSLKDFHKVPAFSLYNQDGANITEQTVANKIFVVDFFFATCPGICPKMTKNMTILQSEFMKDTNVLLLSHSVTPSIDSIPVLKAYAEKYKITSPNWHLLTGNRKEIYNLGRNIYFVEEDLGVSKSEDDFLHTENFVLVDQNGHLRGIYNGLNKTAIQQLITDIYSLKK